MDLLTLVHWGYCTLPSTNLRATTSVAPAAPLGNMTKKLGAQTYSKVRRVTPFASGKMQAGVAMTKDINFDKTNNCLNVAHSKCQHIFESICNVRSDSLSQQLERDSKMSVGTLFGIWRSFKY